MNNRENDESKVPIIFSRLTEDDFGTTVKLNRITNFKTKNTGFLNCKSFYRVISTLKFDE
ncbi:hypothetical protein CLV81_3669 [Flagellimonas meridianipacifica]|uniref:Uncharacterized protein n=1 Tax=Flagellimonas meridianipacifica TaxID=1080225 RepID=A0A2T0MCQ0_9FLAO|nr:hypothetical protein CLV81_3669 [Allomuricauda pacifica]